jgi:hypothetical protein
VLAAWKRRQLPAGGKASNATCWLPPPGSLASGGAPFLLVPDLQGGGPAGADLAEDADTEGAVAEPIYIVVFRKTSAEFVGMMETRAVP